MSKSRPANDLALAKAVTALRMVCASLPHLSGLAAAVRLCVDERVPTAAVTATGRVLVNPHWFAALPADAAAFVMAHELLHLCLRTHQRSAGSDGAVFNWAHDYIINDMLANEMGLAIPAGGLAQPGARGLSAEQMVLLIRQGKVPGPRRMPRGDMTIALQEAGLLPPGPGEECGPGSGDVLPADREREMFPDDDLAQAEAHRRRVERAAERSLRLSVLRQHMERLEANRGGQDQAVQEGLLGILRGLYRPPWEMVLQQWLEAVAPGPRTYARPSRRAGDRTDVVLPGRRREGWTLHIVLDTSGSMVSEIPRVLGLIACFCEGVGVTQVHVLQCDTRVTHDDWVDPAELASYPIAGGGGSDMSPALWHLADDPQVDSALVITDGDITVPTEPPPYQLLWALTCDSSFDPGYGKRLVMG
jgi:predicted metal-dependent peptidase